MSDGEDNEGTISVSIAPEQSERIADVQAALRRAEDELAAARQDCDRANAARERAVEETAKATGKYFFDLECGLAPVSNYDTVGFDVPQGVRLHVNYAPAQDPKTYEVTTAARPGAWPNGEQAWVGIRGKIASGGDWVLVQKDGVATFDTRVTIKTDDGVFIDAVFSGAVDLAAAVPQLAKHARDLGAEVYAAYLRTPPEVHDLPVTLAVRFEAAEQPYLRPGEDGSWIDKSRYSRHKRNFPKYRRLVRSLFVARGTITLDGKPRWPPKQISLAIYNQV